MTPAILVAVAAFRVLVVAANDPYHGAMSDAAKPVLESLGAESGFAVDFTHDATVLNDEDLARHAVVVQLHLAPFDMTKDQQAALQRFIVRGRGWVGIHAAGLTGRQFLKEGAEYWGWFETFLGGVVYSPHPALQRGTLVVEDRTHPITKNLPERMEITDEWYEYDRSPRPNVHVLATADETTYKPNKPMGDHPLVWTNPAFRRMVYIGIGHDPSVCADPHYRVLLRDAIRWAGEPLGAEPVKLDPARMRRVGQVDARFQSYNVEMVEVTGGRFWAPYKSEAAAAEPAAEKLSVPGIDANAFRRRPPIDLRNQRLRTLAAALGPAYMRVSGTWANSTYFLDSDDPPPASPPAGFGGVLTRAQWRAVVEFSKAADARLVTSFAISPGVRDDKGVWTPDQARKLLAYTSSIGGRIAAAEFFNEPNLAVIGGAPNGYDAAAYGHDFRAFLPFIRSAVPGLLVLGPGSVGEGGLLASFPGLKSEDMLTATGPGLDAFSYHFYGGVSKRCAGRSLAGQGGQTSPEAALSEEWLSRTERDARFYAALRDRFEPGRPLWLTETGETACGGNPWASTFIDSFRYLEQLGRLAKLGVQVVMHNTLAASDYGLIDEETLEPRPNYWSAVLWRTLMGATVLDAGPSPAPGVHVYAHCLAGKPGGIALLAVNTDRSAPRDVTVPMRNERYTLASAQGLLVHSLELNGNALALGKDGAMPPIRGVPTPAGPLALPAASMTFLAFADAGNAGCR